ncbi:MAG: hypothetical protein ACSHXF_08155 [Aquaticitalea sp.]
MTVIEKKKTLNKIIDTIPDSNLYEALLLVQDLASKDMKRKNILSKLLETEKESFEKLAQ